MRVTYSIDAALGGGGIGRTALHAVLGLERHRMLHRVLCGSVRGRGLLPRERVRTLGLASGGMRKLAAFAESPRLLRLQQVLHDRWAAGQLDGCDLFHGWNAHCLHSVRRAKASGVPATVERASCHPLFDARVLEEEHARWGLRWRFPAERLERTLTELEIADRVLVPSAFAHRSFLDTGVSPRRLIEIPFGVDVGRYHAPDGKAHAPFRVLFVGQGTLRKGLLYLLQAWERLGWREAELWVAGRLSSNLSPLLERHRSDSRVRWLGFVPDPAPLYRAADAFAFPTLLEGSALVVYEALASGLPVVTTANAGSVVRDGREGFVVPARDVERLAEKLELLRACPRLRRNLGRAARARALEFTWERYGDALAEALCRAREEIAGGP